MKRASATVFGIVQGVMFREAVRELAYSHKLKGSVENLKDGSVRIICEGENDCIEKFFQDVRSLKEPVCVDSIEIEYSEPTGQYKAFKFILGDFASELFECNCSMEAIFYTRYAK